GNRTSRAARWMAMTILSMESARVPSQSKIRVFIARPPTDAAGSDPILHRARPGHSAAPRPATHIPGKQHAKTIACHPYLESFLKSRHPRTWGRRQSDARHGGHARESGGSGR